MIDENDPKTNNNETFTVIENTTNVANSQEDPESEDPESTEVVSDLETRRKLFELREEHRDLDAAIAALQAQDPNDQFSLSRLKRKKLQLKDQIQFFEDKLRPDIIA